MSHDIHNTNLQSPIDPSKLLICWVKPMLADTVRDLEALSRTPLYFQREIDSLAGRPGRGRLWLPFGFPKIDVAEAFDAIRANTALVAILESCGGIVFYPEDLATVARFGIITNQQLNVLVNS